MSVVKRNIVANYLGSLWTAVMSLAFVPVYIHFIGVEAYGLVGVHTTLQAMFTLLDLGLGGAMLREMAKLSVEPDAGVKMRRLVRTLEGLYWTIGIVVGIFTTSAATLIAHRWLKPGQLSPEATQQAIIIMGWCIAFNWPADFYKAGLLGMQRQVTTNLISGSIATLRGLGTILVLWRVSPTVQAFFLWQVFTTLLEATLNATFLWRNLPPSQERARFDLAVLKSLWRFAAGLTGNTLVSLVLGLSDKVILSKLLPLETFGYYALAGTVASCLYRLSSPVFAAVYPRYTQLVAQGDEDGLKAFYHRTSQLMNVLVLPTAAVVGFFAPELLLLWTRNPTTVANVAPILRVMVIGTGLNGVVTIPYALQLAYGWIRFAFYAHAVGMVFSVSLVYFMATRYGSVGAASVWALLNVGFVMVSTPLMHRRLLRGEFRRWQLEDVGIPLAVAVVVPCIGRMLVRSSLPPIGMFAVLAAVSILTLGATVSSAPAMREQVLREIARRRSLHAA